MRSALKIGFGLAAVHVAFIAWLAHAIAVRHYDGGAWLYAALPDLPVYLLAVPFAKFVPQHLDFAFSLVWFGVLGTVQWFFIGWGAASALASACGLRSRDI
jgi:hypothetical protein